MNDGQVNENLSKNKKKTMKQMGIFSYHKTKCDNDAEKNKIVTINGRPPMYIGFSLKNQHNIIEGS